MLKAVELPAGIADLDTSLTDVDRLQAERREKGSDAGAERIEVRDANEINKGGSRRRERKMLGLTMASRILGLLR